MIRARITVYSRAVRLVIKKLHEQLAYCFRLLLLHPVSGPVYQMYPQHSGARCILHFLQVSGVLINTPIALSRNEK